MNTFFVTGFPRSRTAWLANFLSCGDIFCLHDAFKSLRRPSSIALLFSFVHARFVGNSDPANVLFQDQLLAQFPDARWIIIERDQDECERSSRIAFETVGPVCLDLFRKKLDELKTKVDALIVPFEDLDNKAVAIGQFIDPYFYSPVYRNAMLFGLNVQVHPPVLSAGIRDPGPAWVSLSQFIEGPQEVVR